MVLNTLTYVPYKLRDSFSRQINEVGKTNLFLLLILAVITFYPLLFVGFTTHDDAFTGIHALKGDVWKISKDMSIEHGRFNFLWSVPLGFFPYSVDNQFAHLTIKLSAFFLLLGALYAALCQLFKSSWIALTSLLFFVSFIQNGWEHNAITSYPFGFNFLAVLFLTSLTIFSKAIERKNLVLAWFSGGLYFLSLGVELFVLFFPFYVAVLISRPVLGDTVMRRLVSGKQYIFAVTLPLIVYLVIYLSYRLIYPSNYSGNSWNSFNLIAAGKVVTTYSLNAFPITSIRFILFPGEQLQFANSTGLGAILSGSNSTYFVKPAVMGLLFARLMTTKQFIVPKARTLIIGATLTFIGIFLPNLLLGFNQKYQNWVASGGNSFVYTYYSFISAVVFVALILALMNIKSSSWHPLLRLAFVYAGTAIIMFSCFAVEVRNQYIAFDQKLQHRKWQLMDEVLKSPIFMAIPDGATLVAPTLCSHQRGIALVTCDDWSMYTKYKSGKDVQFVNDKCVNLAPCYSLVFRQASHSDDQFIVLAKIGPGKRLTSSDLSIYSMPNHSSATVIGSFVPNVALPDLEINNVPIINIGSGLFSATLPSISGDGFVQTARLSGNIDIIPEQITISHFIVEPRLRPLSAELADGIDFKKQDYPDFLAEVSGVSGYEKWGRWTDAAVSPSAKFRFKQSLPRKFTLEIVAIAFGPNYGAPVKVRVGSAEKTFVINPKIGDPYRLFFETEGATDTLEIIPPTPTSPHEIDPNNGDARRLGIGFVSIKLKG